MRPPAKQPSTNIDLAVERWAKTSYSGSAPTVSCVVSFEPGLSEVDRDLQIASRTLV
jgi:hypothetical protein